jgi:hypothetical protein
MRTSLIIASLILCCCMNLMNAQDTVTRKRIHKTTVRILSDPSFICYGVLYEVNDSSILISSRRLKHYNSDKVETLKFPVGDLKLIHTRKTGNGGKGAWIGAASGVALGTLFGVLSGGNAVLNRGDAMVVGAVFGFVVGVPTGFTVGRIAGHKKTQINGSMDKFNLIKDELTDYAIQKYQNIGEWYYIKCGVTDINNCTLDEFECLWSKAKRLKNTGISLTVVGTTLATFAGVVLLTDPYSWTGAEAKEWPYTYSWWLFGAIGVPTGILLDLIGIPCIYKGSSRKSQLKNTPYYKSQSVAALNLNPTILRNHINNTYSIGLTAKISF